MAYRTPAELNADIDAIRTRAVPRGNTKEEVAGVLQNMAESSYIQTRSPDGTVTNVNVVDTEDDVWFGPPRDDLIQYTLADPTWYATYGGIAGGVRFYAINPGAINPAACAFGDFANATALTFLAGKRVLIASGANVGVWYIDAGAVSLTRDPSWTVVANQTVTCVESHSGLVPFTIKTYRQTAATGGAVGTAVFEEVTHEGDEAAFNALLTAEMARVDSGLPMRRIRFRPSVTPYVWIDQTVFSGQRGRYRWRVRGEKGATLVTCLAVFPDAQIPALFQTNNSSTGTTTTVTATARKGAMSIQIDSATGFVVGVYIGIGVTPTSHSHVYEIQSIAANGGNFDIGLNKSLPCDVEVGVTVSEPDDLAVDCEFEFGEMVISGTGSRWFSGGGQQDCNWTATLSSQHGNAFAIHSFDLGCRDCTIELDGEIDKTDASVVFEGSVNCWLQNSRFRGLYVNQDGTLGSGIRDSYIEANLASAAQVACGHTQAPYNQGTVVRGCVLVGGNYGVLSQGAGVGTDCRDLLVTDCEFVGQASFGIYSGGVGARINNTAFRLPSDSTCIPIAIWGSALAQADAVLTGIVCTSTNKGTACMGGIALRAVYADVQANGLKVADVNSTLYATTARVNISGVNIDIRSCLDNDAYFTIAVYSGSTVNIDSGIILQDAAGSRLNFSMSGANNRVAVSRFVTTGGGTDFSGGATDAVSMGAGCVLGATNLRSTLTVTSAQAGVVAKAITTANVTLTSTESQAKRIELSDVPTAARTVFVKSFIGAEYTVANACTGGNAAVTLKVDGEAGAGVSCPGGATTRVAVTSAGLAVAA